MSKITDEDTLIDDTTSINNDRGNEDSEYIGYDEPEENLDDDDKSVIEKEDVDENPSENGEVEDSAKESDKDQITPDLMYEAISKGLSKQDILSFSASELRKTLNVIKPIQQEKEEPEKKFEEVKKLEWDRDNFDDDQNNVFDQLNEKLQQQQEYIQELVTSNQNVNQLIDIQNQNDQAVFMTYFDNLIDGLGTDFHDVLGAGKSKELGQGHQGNIGRNDLVEHMDMLINGSKGRSLSTDDAFKMAINNLYPEKQLKIANDSIKKKLKSSNGGMSLKGRSTNTGFSEKLRKMTPTEKAEEAVGEKLQEYGFD